MKPYKILTWEKKEKQSFEATVGFSVKLRQQISGKQRTGKHLEKNIFFYENWNVNHLIFESLTLWQG